MTSTRSYKLRDDQHDLVMSLYPMVMTRARRYWFSSTHREAARDAALDGLIRGVASYRAGSHATLETYVTKCVDRAVWRAMRVESRRIGRREDEYREPYTHDPGPGRVDDRDEIEKHLDNATPRQQYAMLDLLHGIPSEPKHVNRCRVAVTDYRDTRLELLGV